MGVGLDTADFFRLVLPASGVYYSVQCKPVPGKDRPVFIHTPCHTPEELSRAVRGVDNSGSGAAYFACAAYKADGVIVDNNTRYRVESNQRAAKSFWADLDCGADKAANGKGYADRKEAAADLLRFCEVAKFPKPLTVSSGYGLHCYWPLASELEAKDWKRNAEILKQIFAYFGLRADPTRTADFASILRPPGTHNRKNVSDAKAVKVIREQAPYTVSEFLAAINNVVLNHNVALPPTPSPAGPSINDDLLAHLRPTIPSSADRAADKCAQMRRMRETKGDVSYDHWRGVVGVIKHCTEGLPLAIEWSSLRGQTRDSVNVEDKFNTWNAGPATCDFFAKINPSECDKCPYKGKIKSPIVLGHPDELPTVQIKVEQVVEGKPVQIEVPVYSKTYRYENGAMSKFEKDKDGIWHATPFAKRAFHAVSGAENEDRTYLMGVRAYTNTDKREALLPLGYVGTGGADLLDFLSSSLGVMMTPNQGADKLARDYLREEWNRLQDEAKIVQTFSTFGWKNDHAGFLVGNTMLQKDGTERTYMLSGSAKAYEHHLAPHGELAKWTEAINAIYNRPGMESMQYTICSLLASPLSVFCGPEYKGIPVALTSGRTGKGKSTAAWAGLSAYGDPDALMINGAQGATRNAGSLILAMLQNLPVLFDELTNVEPGALSDMLYSASNGKERIRVKMEGGKAKLSESLTWNLNSAMTANKSLTGVLVSTGARVEAESVRVLEVKIDQENIPRLDLEIIEPNTRQFRDNRGHAGRAFLKYIVTHQDETIGRLNRLMDEIKAGGGTLAEQEQRFYRYHYITTMVAAEIGNDLGLFSFDLAALRAWADKMLLGRVADVQDQAAQTTASALDRMLSEMMGRIIVTSDYRSGGDARGAEGVERISGTLAGRYVRGVNLKDPETAALAGKLLLNSSEAKNWCTKARLDLGQIVDELRTKGLYGGEYEFNLTRGTSLLPVRVRCIEVNYDKFVSAGAGKAAAKFSVVKNDDTEEVAA